LIFQPGNLAEKSFCLISSSIGISSHGQEIGAWMRVYGFFSRPVFGLNG
jgi:hypothetical protein